MLGLILAAPSRARFAICAEQIGVISQVRAYYLLRMAAQDHFRAQAARHGASWMRALCERAGWERSELGWPECARKDENFLLPPGPVKAWAAVAYARVMVAGLRRSRRFVLDSLSELGQRHGSDVAVAAMAAAGGWSESIMGSRTRLVVRANAGAN